jgi:hypothetical protein
MTGPVTLDLFESLDFFLKGDSHAVAFCVDIIFLAHLIDDLVDRDVERSVEDVKIGFRKLLCDFPNNPFYKQFYPQLSTLMASTYMMWLDSTSLEKGSEEERFICFQIRNTTMNIVHHCILLVGGVDWAQEQGVAFWKLFAPKQEKLEELLNE